MERPARLQSRCGDCGEVFLATRLWFEEKPIMNDTWLALDG